MRRYEHSFTVYGSGPFPIDMLRYDCCWPASSLDSMTIRQTIEKRAAQSATVRLMSHHDEHHWRPAADRWRNFGWHLSEHVRHPNPGWQRTREQSQ